MKWKYHQLILIKCHWNIFFLAMTQPKRPSGLSMTIYTDIYLILAERGTILLIVCLFINWFGKLGGKYLCIVDMFTPIFALFPFYEQTWYIFNLYIWYRIFEMKVDKVYDFYNHSTQCPSNPVGRIFFHKICYKLCSKLIYHNAENNYKHINFQ